MKKILFAICSLFVLYGVQAQTVTEIDLIGEWHMAKVDMDGYILDFDTKTVTAKDPENEGSEEMEYARYMLNLPKFQEQAKQKILFKPGGIIEMPDSEGNAQGSYSFEEKDGQKVLYISLTADAKIEARIEEGLLRIGSVNRKHNAAMYLKKDKK